MDKGWSKLDIAMIKKTILYLICLWVFFSGVGCGKKFAWITPFQPFKKTITKDCQSMGESVQKRAIDYCVFGDGEDVIFIIGSIHGNEPAGKLLVEKLGEYLDEKPDLLVGRKVVLLAAANPDGLASRSRFNANRVDLNRNFEAANRINNKRSGYHALSEPESVVIYNLIEKYKPDRIVSIHQLIDAGSEKFRHGHLRRRRPPALIDYDGDAKALAELMSVHSNLPVKKMGARPGSLGSYAGIELDIGIITLELPGQATDYDSDRLWNLYGQGLVAAITYDENM